MVPGTELAPTLGAINRETLGRKSVHIPIQAQKLCLPPGKWELWQKGTNPASRSSCLGFDTTRLQPAPRCQQHQMLAAVEGCKDWPRCEKKKLLPPLLSAPHQEIALSTTRSLPGLQGAGWRGSPTGAFPTGRNGVGGSCGAAPSPPQCQELPPAVPSCSHSC